MAARGLLERAGMDGYASWPVFLAIALVLLVGAAGFAGLYVFAVRSARDDEAAALQQALMEPIAREPALAGTGVTPVVTWPWHRRPRVELTGWVPSREIRDAAVRAVAREAAKLGRAVRIVDSLEVLDRQERRRA
jgi:hypothetical protein